MKICDILNNNESENLLKEWLEFREEELCSLTCDEDRKHHIYISEKILKNVPKQNRKYVQKQLGSLDENFMDYIDYWNEKYYRNGFCDGVQLIGGSSYKLKRSPILGLLFYCCILLIPSTIDCNIKYICSI